MKLDAKDRKLLYELDVDCSQPLSQIAKKIGISKEVVAYRIKRLKKEGVVTALQAQVNLPKIGYMESVLFLKLSSAEKRQMTELAEYCKNLDNSFYVVRNGGPYDFHVGLLVKNVFEFERLVKDIISRFSGIIVDSDIITRTTFYQFPRDYLIGEVKNPRPVFTYSEPKGYYDLNYQERAILKQVAEDSSQSIYDISKKTGIPPSTVRYKIKYLQSQDVIMAHKAFIDDSKLGKNITAIFIKTRGLSRTDFKSLVEYCEQDPSIISVSETVGRWDLEIYFVVDKIIDAHDKLMEMTDKFKGLIRETNVLPLFEVYKYDFYPFRLEK